MIRVRKSVLALVAAAASVSLLAACGGSGGGSSSATGTGQVRVPDSKTNNSADGLATTDRSQLRSGGKITWSLTGTIPNFNYYELDGTLQDNISILNGLLPRPFHFDASGTPSVNTDFFTSIKQTSTTPETIEYKINPKAVWSDGSKVSYLDFKDLANASNGKNTAYNVSATQGYDQIASVTRGTDDQDVIVKFGKTFTDWQSLFDPLVPSSLTSTPAAFNKGWIAKPAVTAGPFMWGSSNKTAQTYTVNRNPKWWGNPALLDSITYAVYNDPSAAVQALGTHEVDVDDITGGDIVANVAAAKKYSGVTVRETGGNIYRQFTFNTKDSTLSDVKVRQAVQLGVDRNAITTALIGKLGGNPTALDNHFFMKNQASYTSTCGEYCTYNPTKAKALLSGDGYTLKNGFFEKNGKVLTIAITIPSDTPNSKAEAEISQSTLAKAGIKLTITTVPTNDFFAKYIDAGKFQLTTFTWYGTPFPIGGALSIFKYDPSNKGQNYGFGGNAQINTLLSNAYTSTTAAQENTLANTASKDMWANAAWLPLYQKPQAVAVTSTLYNIGANGFADIHYDNIGFKK